MDICLYFNTDNTSCFSYILKRRISWNKPEPPGIDWNELEPTETNWNEKEPVKKSPTKNEGS